MQGSFTEGEKKGEIKSQIRAVLRPIPLISSTVKENNLFKRENRKKRKRGEQRRPASPATNYSQACSMTKQPCFGEQPIIREAFYALPITYR